MTKQRYEHGNKRSKQTEAMQIDLGNSESFGAE